MRVTNKMFSFTTTAEQRRGLLGVQEQTFTRTEEELLHYRKRTALLWCGAFLHFDSVFTGIALHSV